MIETVIYLVIIGLIFWVIWWALGQFAIPEPFNKVARVIVVLLAVVVVLNILLGLLGSPPSFKFPGR